ncbi:hypothetical protein GCM10028801_01440 [Nocardioides maradonensis]
MFTPWVISTRPSGAVTNLPWAVGRGAGGVVPLAGGSPPTTASAATSPRAAATNENLFHFRMADTIARAWGHVKHHGPA